jgi:hypothetical protein
MLVLVRVVEKAFGGRKWSERADAGKDDRWAELGVRRELRALSGCKSYPSVVCSGAGGFMQPASQSFEQGEAVPSHMINRRDHQGRDESVAVPTPVACTNSLSRVFNQDTSHP